MTHRTTHFKIIFGYELSNIEIPMVTIATILNVTASLILYEMLFIQPVTCGACGDTKSQCTPQNETKFDFRRVLKENRKYSPRVNICNLRIYGGIAAKICDVPYQVAIRRKKSTGRVWRTFCGGAIVTKNHVVTAAHCFDRGTKKFIEETRVAAGADHSDVHLFGDTSMRRSLLREIMIEETWRQIKDCYKHAHYSTTLVHHDIAVLVLNRPLKFSSKIQPIPMLTKQTRSTLDADIPCLTSGFGIMDHGKSSPTLRFVCVAVVPIDWCRLTYQSMELLGEFQICAGGSGKDSCQGDSGSPMACQGLLSGIVSYGGECGAAPGVYTLLSGYTHGNYVPFVRSFSIKLNHNIIEIMFVVHPFVYYMMFSY